jgi:hypothetical protein
MQTASEAEPADGRTVEAHASRTFDACRLWVIAGSEAADTASDVWWAVRETGLQPAAG